MKEVKVLHCKFLDFESEANEMLQQGWNVAGFQPNPGFITGLFIRDVPNNPTPDMPPGCSSGHAEGAFLAARGILKSATAPTEPAEVTIRRIRDMFDETVFSGLFNESDIPKPTPDSPLNPYTAPANWLFCDRLRWLRWQSDLTLADASHAAGISLPYLSDLERGRTLPSLAVLYKLAAVYSLTASELLRGVVLPDESEAGRDDE